MTFFDLLHKIEWVDVKPHIERHLTECHGMKLSDYERLYDRLRKSAPARWIRPGTFRFYLNIDCLFYHDWEDISHDTIDGFGHYVANHAFGLPWEIALATRVEQLGYLHLSDTEWAAYCLWEISREKIEREVPRSMRYFLQGRHKPHFLNFGQFHINYKIKRLCKRLASPCPPMESDKARLRKRLRRIEATILRITGKDMDQLVSKRISEKKRERIGNLIGERKVLLDRMFAATPAEVERMERVNSLLLDLTGQMYRRSAELYRKVLTSTCDRTFDDDVLINSSLRYNCNDEESVLSMTNDRYYGSDFFRMLNIIDWLYSCGTEGFRLPEIEAIWGKTVDLKDNPSKSDAELDFVDNFNDGTTWAEASLDHPALRHICICHAVHDICTHKDYSIPDLLRMNDFWCEVKITHQHIVEQDGRRWQWWMHCPFEEFRDKFRAEAEHRPDTWRLGQYIVNRTKQIFPEAVRALVEFQSSAWEANNCFNDDEKVDAYLRRLYDTLQKRIES